MEIKREEVTPEQYAEWDRLKREQECAECGLGLDIYTVPEHAAFRFGCFNAAHHGFRQRTCATEDLRRGVAVLPSVQSSIEAKMIDKVDTRRAFNLLALRFPKSIKDPAGAALFINDCMRLGLDPLIQPAEAVPILFKSVGEDRKVRFTVAMVITEDGYLSMAARGCPEEYAGAPATMPLVDYLAGRHPERPLAELKEMAAAVARDLCDDGEAFVWVALGKRRTAADPNPVYGYYRRAEWYEAKNNRLPAATQPGNQARVRAVKRWVRENFPECRAKMLEYTADVVSRSAGAAEARRFIDAEYRLLLDAGETPQTPPPAAEPGKAAQNPPGGHETQQDTKSADLTPQGTHSSLPGRAKARNELARNTGTHKPAITSTAARTQGTNRDDNKVGEPAERSAGKRAGLSGGGITAGGDKAGGDPTAPPSGTGEHTLLSSPTQPDIANPSEAAAVVPGTNIRVEWLNQMQKALKWRDKTLSSWIAHKFPGVQDDGNLPKVLARLAPDQVKLFCKELQAEADKQQPNLL